tara:strand:+ start:331 stop:627 length:297 start_codon:yes stop_codon:yes gene_type:complete
MPSSLIKDIEKKIAKKMELFTTQVSEKYTDVSKEELLAIWNEVCGLKAKKVSNFQIFCKEKRPELKQKNPDMKFGDMNRELGKLWKKLSDDDKKKYNK